MPGSAGAGESAGNGVVAPRWQRVLRSTTAALLGLGLAAGLASLPLKPPDPRPSELEGAAQLLAPGGQVSDAQLRRIDDTGLGRRKLQAMLRPEPELGAVETRAEAAGLRHRRVDDGDEVAVDLGPAVAYVGTERISVVRQYGLVRALLLAVAGVAGALALSARSVRRSRRRQTRGATVRRALLSASGLPLGILLLLGWGAILISANSLELPGDYSALVLGATLLLAGLWVPLGGVVATVVGLLAVVGGARGPGPTTPRA